MTYYLGKVGRVGARLVSSCKDLYNDVNAAYLTGATDVVVVKQKDGSLKSTPFHVRFGKLGVLRTGDLKEVGFAPPLSPPPPPPPPPTLKVVTVLGDLIPKMV